MVPRIHPGGRGMSGLVDYVTHDQTTPDDLHPTSATRVGWTAVLNLPACPPEIAALIMSRTAADADRIKREAGTSTKGRKLQKPVAHLSLSWKPNERPDRAEMMTAVRGALKSIGYDKCQALVAEHHDRDQLHVHIALCRVDPSSGKACGRTNDAIRLSAWAEKHERSRGPLLIPVRESRNDCRQAFAAAVDHEMSGWTPTAAKTKRDQAIERTAARRQAIERVRTTDRHHLPPTAAPAARGPGRPGPHSPEDRAAWSALHAEHAAADTTPRIQRTERVEVARILRDTRAVTVQADEIQTMAGPAVRPAAPAASPVRVPAAPGREIPPLRRGSSVRAVPAAPPVRVPAAPGREIPPLRRGSSVRAVPAAPPVRVPAAPGREIPPLRRGSSVRAVLAAPPVRVPAAPGREIPPLRRGSSVRAVPAAPPVRVPAAPARPAARERHHIQTAGGTPVDLGELRRDLEARARDRAVIELDEARRDKARRDKAREARVAAAAVRDQAGAAARPSAGPNGPVRAAMAEFGGELTTDAGAGIGAERPAPVGVGGRGSETGPRRGR